MLQRPHAIVLEEMLQGTPEGKHTLAPLTARWPRVTAAVAGLAAAGAYGFAVGRPQEAIGAAIPSAVILEELSYRGFERQVRADLRRYISHRPIPFSSPAFLIPLAAEVSSSALFYAGMSKLAGTITEYDFPAAGACAGGVAAITRVGLAKLQLRRFQQRHAARVQAVWQSAHALPGEELKEESITRILDYVAMNPVATDRIANGLLPSGGYEPVHPSMPIFLAQRSFDDSHIRGLLAIHPDWHDSTWEGNWPQKYEKGFDYETRPEPAAEKPRSHLTVVVNAPVQVSTLLPALIASCKDTQYELRQERLFPKSTELTAYVAQNYVGRVLFRDQATIPVHWHGGELAPHDSQFRIELKNERAYGLVKPVFAALTGRALLDSDVDSALRELVFSRAHFRPKYQGDSS